MLFTCVFSAIFGDIDKHLTEAQVESTQKAVRQCLNNVLSSSTQYDPSFIGSLQVRRTAGGLHRVRWSILSTHLACTIISVIQLPFSTSILVIVMMIQVLL